MLLQSVNVASICGWMWKGGKEMSALNLRETFRRCGQGCWFDLAAKSINSLILGAS